MKRLLMLCAALSVAAGASANTYYSDKGSNGAWSKILKWYDVSTGDAASVTPAANDGHIWVLAGAATFTSANTDAILPDTTWYWGSDGQALPVGACIYSQSFGNGSTTTANETRHFTVPHCTVFGCEIMNNMGSGTSTLYLSGDYTFKHVDSQEIAFKCNGSGTNIRPIVLDENFKATGDDDVTLKFTCRTKASDGISLSLRGDFAAFRGSYDVTKFDYLSDPGCCVLKLESPTAMGDPTSAKTDAVTLHNQTKLAIGPDVVQSATRGITLALASGEKAYIGTVGGTANDAVTVTSPIYGSTGTLVKNDLGTVTLAGSVEATNIEVAEGTLVLGMTGAFANGLRVNVASGAKLIQMVAIPNLEISGEGAVESGVHYSAASSKNGDFSTVITWKDAFTDSADSPTPPAAGDGKVWVLAGAKTLNVAERDTILPDTTWYWGSDGQALPVGACIYSQSFGNGSTTIANETRHFAVPHCTVFGCEIVNNMGSGSSTLYLSGDYTFKHVDGQDVAFKCNGSNQNVRPIVFDENFMAAGEQDVTLKFSSRVKVTDAYGVWTSLRGDFSAFKGGYDVSVYDTASGYNGLGTLKLESPTAMGDPTSAKTDAVTLHNQTKLAIALDVVQSATRGITLALGDGEKASIGTVGGTVNDAVTVTAPIYGSTGTLVKNDLGTVTLAGSVEATNIEVAEGTLVLGEMGLFPAGLAVTVKSGAKLVQRKHVKGLTVVCEDGGVWEKDIQQVVIYDASSDACEPLDFEDRDPESPLLRLSAMMNLPFSAEKALDVMKLPMTTKMKAEDFVDATEKTFGLPQTWFELEERDDCQMLVLHARPVVVSVREFADADGGLNAPNADAADFPWSDGPGMFGDRDYLLQHRLSGFGSDSFAGHSLTVAPATSEVLECWVRKNSSVMESWIDKACAYPGVMFRGNDGSVSSARVYGALTLMGTLGAEEGVTFRTRQASNNTVMRMDVRASLAGSGTAILDLQSSGAWEVELSGSNGDYAGCILAKGHQNCAENKEMRLHFGKANQLGGAMEAFVFNALELRNYTLLRPRHSVVLEATNRGIYVNGNGGFLVDMDVTNTTQPVELTVNEPIRVNGTLYKQGAGTLTLGSVVTFGADGTGTVADFIVRAGTVKLLPGAQVRGLNCTFADGTKLSLDPAATEGFCGNFAVEGSLAVSLSAQPKGKGVSFKVPICTVPAGTADLTGKFVGGTESAGWRFSRIVRETDAQGDHYFAEYVTRALRCVVR